ncbi:hypothetical protein BCA37_16880 [Mycobacterium sp. djl-10]|nr:hypothetical protein BCA37_16880 [Mycobacterium sp. djl-10]
MTGTAGAHPVVVGIDGSDSGLGAARWAAALAAALGTSLHLVHSESTADQCTGAQQVLAKAQAAVRQLLPALQVTSEVVTEPADVALIRRSRTAGFVVTACDDVSRTAAVLLGSTTLTVATRAECPVVAWRGTAAPTTAAVVVGVAFGEADSEALATAFTLAEMFAAPVTAVHAWSTTRSVDHATVPYLIDWDAVERNETRGLRTAVQPWAERHPDVEVRYVVDIAKPSRALLDRLADAQLVVVATHRSNALAAALLGSTTLNLLHHSPIPVVVCQTPNHP